MDYISITGIGAGLAMDAFAVCITNGAVTKKVTFPFALKLALCFGIFQAAMPIAGWLVGKAGESIISAVDHWIALILLSYIGIQMLIESRKKSNENGTAKIQDNISAKTLFTLGIATSIDALITGIILPSAVGASAVWQMLVAVTIIGMITFVICLAGVYIGKKFGEIFSSKAEVFGGIVLIAIGVKIFTEHMF
ncbi:MAG TPA: manganese efflux pump MntP family protein [Caproiciproducens sp.]|nr:manganese efflux pump MntP family protein [Caproiciproducens sp.]